MDAKRRVRNAELILFSVAIVLYGWATLYGPTWPWADSYDFFLYMDEIKAGNLSFHQFITARDNEHLIAFHLAFAIISLEVFGLRTKALIMENAALLWLGGAFLWLILRHTALARSYPVLSCMAVALPLLNPSQVGFLLWEFQNWWYLDFAMVGAIVLLVERFSFRAYVPIFILCLFASGSQAQGSFLWLSSAMHFLLISMRSEDNRQRIKAITVAFGHVVIFCVLAWVLLSGVNTNIGRTTGNFGFGPHTTYFVKMIGGGFGCRDERVAFGLGLISVALWATFVIRVVRGQLWSTENRVAIILTGLAMLWILAFTIGRESLGVQWAFQDFHEAPMLVPFFIGIALFSLSWAHQTQLALGRSGLIVVGISVAILPLLTGASYGYKHSRFMRANSDEAVAAICVRRDIPRSAILKLVGLESYGTLFDNVSHYNEQLCAVQPETLLVSLTPAAAQSAREK